MTDETPDLTGWAEDMHKDGLEPSPCAGDVALGDRVIARVHFAFAPDVPASARMDFAMQMVQAAADAAGG